MTDPLPIDSPRERLAWRLCLVAVFLLPWVGVGLIHLVSGRDMGGGLQPSWLAMGLAAAFAAPGIVRWLGGTARGWLRGMGPWAVALLLSGAGLLIAPAQEAAGVQWWRWAKQVIQLDIMLLFVVVPAYFLARGAPVAALGRALVWGAVFQAGYGVLQAVHFQVPLPGFAGLEHVFTSNPSIFAGSGQLYLDNALQPVPRLRGTLCEPLYLGSYLLVVLPLLKVTGWPRAVRRVAMLVGLLLLVGTWSRGAWLAGGAAGLFWLGTTGAWRDSNLRRGAAVAGAVLVLVLVAGWMFQWDAVTLPPRRLVQTFSTVDWSNLTRFYSMQAAWRGFLLSPLVGIGWGQFGFHFAALADPMGLQAMFTWPVVNNLPLAVLCETGVLGLGAAGWALWRLGWAAVRARRHLADFEAAAVVGAAVGALGVGLQLLTFSQYNLPHIWLPLGILAGLAARERTAP